MERLSCGSRGGLRSGRCGDGAVTVSHGINNLLYVKGQRQLLLKQMRVTHREKEFRFRVLLVRSLWNGTSMWKKGAHS